MTESGKRNPALRIVLLYLLSGCLWIAFSDSLLALVSSRNILIQLSTIKGLIFVCITAAFLYYLIHRHFTDLEVLRQTQAKSEERLRMALLASCTGVWEWDLRTDLVVWSPEVYGIVGLKDFDGHFESFGRLLHPDDAERVTANVKAALAERVGYADEFRIIMPDSGEVRWLANQGQGKYDSDGTPVSLLGTVRDITAYKNTEIALRKSEERYRTVVEDQTEIIGRVLPDGTITFINDVYCRIFGRQRNELVGTRWHPVVHTEDLKMVEEQLLTMSPEHPVVIVENRVCVATGELRWMQFVNRGIYDENGVLQEIQAVARDITDRKRIEDELRRSEAELNAAQEISHIGSWRLVVDEHGERWSGSRELYRIYGHAPDTVMTMQSGLDRMHPDDREAVLDCWSAAMQGSGPREWEHRIIVEEQTRWVHVSVQFDFDGSGKFRGANGTVQDITDRKRAQELFRKNDESLRRFYESGMLGVVYWNINGSITEANDKFLEMVGYSREELAAGAINWISMTPPEYSHLDKKCVEELLATGVNRKPFEKEYVCKNGTRIPVLISGAMLDQNRIDGIAYILDISDLKRAEHAMRTLTERLQTVQELERLAIARDIHDEIGQQLTALKLDIAWLRHRISADRNEPGERLDDMGSNIDLLIGCVQRIAADLRPPLLDNLGLAAAIGWQVNEFTRRSGIECLTMLNEDAEPSDSQTSTAIVRIVQEALTNVIRHSEATEVSISLCRNDGGLLLEISDNGRGVSEDELAARDAYGLIGMQERARICHGELTVTGSPGCGTRLRLTIPHRKGGTEL